MAHAGHVGLRVLGPVYALVGPTEPGQILGSRWAIGARAGRGKPVLGQNAARASSDHLDHWGSAVTTSSRTWLSTGTVSARPG